MYILNQNVRNSAPSLPSAETWHGSETISTATASDRRSAQHFCFIQVWINASQNRTTRGPLRCSGHWESCLCVVFVLKCVWQMLFSCQTDPWARPQEVSPSLSSLACPANRLHGPRVVLSVTISCPCWFAAANSAKVYFYRGKQQIYSFSADCLANLCLSFHQ